MIAKDKARNAKKAIVTVYGVPKPKPKPEPEPKPELKPLTISKTVEKDGIRFDVTFSSNDFKPNGELNVKVKATNISDEATPYVGFDGSDRGIKADIFTEDMNGQVFKGSNKPSNIVGNMMVSYYSLAPDESTEETNVFYLTTKGLNDHVYANIAFQKRIDDQLELIEVQIDIKE